MPGFTDRARGESCQHRSRRVDETAVSGRRTNAAVLRGQVREMLLNRLPAGWHLQVMPAAGSVSDVDEKAHPDILVISPAGRCHFLFTKAPEDRWWDGDIRRVPAEPLTAAERTLIGRLKRGGHSARPVWRPKDAARALASWGCKLHPEPAEPAEPASAQSGVGAAKRTNPARARLALELTEGTKDGR